MEKKTAEKKITTAKKTYIYAKGGRKTSTCQCRLYKSGKGEILVNDKPFKDYFKTEELQNTVLSPLVLTNHQKDIDLSLKTHGGGQQGQAGSCRHAISRALDLLDKELRAALKAEGFLKRDPRAKERKKPGLRGARRAPQWSKR